MPSLSQPQTPSKHHSRVAEEKWTTASCSEIDKISIENKDSPLLRAKYTQLRSKREAIAKFLKEHKNEDLSLYIDELRDLAVSNGGLVDDEFRAIIWPILADNLLQAEEKGDDAGSSNDSDFESAFSELEDSSLEDEQEADEDVLRQHKEWHQVELDVNRTLARFPPNITDVHRTTLQKELIPLIVRVLRLNPRFNYYQGFHDICLTVLLVCGVKDSFRICSNLARNGAFNNYLLKSLEGSVVKELDLMYVILSRVEPQLEKMMRSVELGSIFALSWPLTWFSHSLQHYQQIVRFFDCFLAAPRLLPVYVASTIVVFRKSSIFSCEREMPFIHRLLSEMPHELPVDAILKDAVYLAKLMPPTLLRTHYYEEYRKTVAAPPRNLITKTIPRFDCENSPNSTDLHDSE
ncbi:unnamed protein product [Caenorhabditis auriculariae]|uniref:Rab-GAP TBC domain-containing protein n=1 Tax=Caenorhabditis auriculariae TaxID=2777116 RepID=A0A8S1HKR2_9PELO|nr:unnamed protein product [Caenorhabditis auriculariae]